MRINPSKIIRRRTSGLSSVTIETLKKSTLENTIANSDYECLLKRDYNGDYSERYKKAGR